MQLQYGWENRAVLKNHLHTDGDPTTQSRVSFYSIGKNDVNVFNSFSVFKNPDGTLESISFRANAMGEEGTHIASLDSAQAKEFFDWLKEEFD